jgi:2-oxoglutarate/2-oxoacid ferredoxin oxidoreductase subunit alpha
MGKILMKGNEAVGEAAIKAGCRYFFGYPITPQNEIPEYMSRELPKHDGCYLQGESEIASINMIYGAAGSGARCMTSSSSPGVQLKTEGISYLVGAELPCVIVNMVRGGPGLGTIQPSQADYNMATKAPGHGDLHLVVLAPSSVQEAVDLVIEAFDIADQYRNPVMVVGDGMIGQMMEPVEFRTPKQRNLPQKDWAAKGTKNNPGNKRNIINSLYLQAQELEAHVNKIFEKYEKIQKDEIKVEVTGCDDDPELICVAYGTTARIVKSVRDELLQEGIHIGLIRPITLWPFPFDTIRKYRTGKNLKGYLSVEMSKGQMVDDVKLAVGDAQPVYFAGRTGGMIPEPGEIKARIKELLGK